MENTRAFVTSLFDFSFSDFVAPKIIGILYGLLLVLAGIGTIALIAYMFAISARFGVLALLVLGPLYLCISILGYRVMLELVVVIFRIKQELADMHSTVSEKK